MFRVPQSIGTPGWIVFTYENNTPVCLWLTKSIHECKKLPCIADERICGDTFLRVEKVGPLEFVIADIWMYNSNCVFACSTFKQRYDWLKDLLKMFTASIPGTVKLIHKSDFKFTKIRGYEEHNDETIGRPGYFVENDNSVIVRFSRLEIPDCYKVVGGVEYLKVPDLKTSKYLRSKPSEFECRCIKNDDQSWILTENIPSIDVNASS